MADWKRGCPEWLEENGRPRAERQRREVLHRLVLEDCRRPPSADMVRDWHRHMFAGLAPHPDYPGNFRDLDQVPYCLQDCEVRVGDARGVPCGEVLSAVAIFFQVFARKLADVEQRWRTRQSPPDEDDIDQVVKLAAWAHGEWVRIHPFINGNGRTARLLANYVFTHEPFGFGPVVAVRPRPTGRYAEAARRSMMTGDHPLMEEVFWDLLVQSYSRA